MFKLTKFTLFSTLLFIALFSIKPAFAKSELLNVVTVCKRGCDYKNMQTAVNYSSSDDLIVIKEMMYGKAAAFTVTGAPRHNINIICEPGAGLNAYKLNTLIAGSKASPLTISSCILKGAKSYLLDVNTSPYVLNLRNNSLEGAKVKSGYGAILTANRFDNVEVESALAGVTIINNTFRSTKNGLTALKLYPTGTSNVLHNSFDGYDTVTDPTLGTTYQVPKYTQTTTLSAEGQKAYVLANNSDGLGHSYGSHLNFLISRTAWENLFRRAHETATAIA